MQKRWRYYLLLPLVAALVAVGDYLYLFHGGVAARLIENEIRRTFGERVTFETISAASDLRSFSAHGARLLSTEAHAFAEAARIEIRFNGPCDAVPRPPVAEVVFTTARLRLSERFLPDLNGFLRALRNSGGGMAGIPDILLTDGTATIDFPKIFSSQAAEWSLRGLRFSRLPGEDGYAITGGMEHRELGLWSVHGQYRIRDNGGQIVLDHPSFEIPDRVARFFEPSLAERIDALRPRGKCAFSVTIPFNGVPSVVIRPSAMEWNPPAVVDRLTATGGVVTIMGKTIDLRDLFCVADDGGITIRGTTEPGPDETIDLEIVGRKIPAERVIATLGVLLRSPPRFSIRGNVDFLWRMRKEKDRTPSHEIAFGLDEGSLISGAVVVPLRMVRGDAVVTADSVTIGNLRGSSRDTTFAFDGVFRPDTSAWSVSVEGLEFRPELLTFLPPSIADLAGRVNIGGIVSGRVKFDGSGNEAQRTSRVDIEARLARGTTAGLLAFDGIAGTFRAALTLQPESWSLEGDLDIARMNAAGREIRGLTCGLRSENGSIHLIDLQALFCGGVLTGQATIDTATGHLKGSLAVRDIDLQSLAGSGSKKEIKGRIDIDMPATTFEIGRIRPTLEGTGTVRFRDVYLWDVPIFFHMLNLNLFTFETKPVFRAGALGFSMSGEQIRLSEIAFDGDNINITGKGGIDFDGNLRMILNTRTKTMMTGIPGVGIIESAIDMVKDNIYAIEITGTFAHPEHKARLLPSLRPER